MPAEFSEKAIEEADAAIKASQSYQPSRAARRLRSIENAVGTVADSPYASEVYTVVKDQVDNFAKTSKNLMALLDAVADVHPFIHVAVSLFKAGIQLELTRRENDDRVLALKVTMCDLMSTLKDLKQITSPRDKISIEDRLRARLGAVIESIKLCAKLCDTYQKRHTVVKYFTSFKWQEKFAEVAQQFVDHKAEIQSVLTQFISIRMDRLVDNVEKLMEFVFERMRSPEERKIKARVESSHPDGMEAAQKDKKFLEQLLQTPQRSNDQKKGKNREQGDVSLTVAELQQEVNKDVNQVIQENKYFDRKFEAMMRQMDDIKMTIKRESDRTISQILAGPHCERIHDKDMSQIWKEMGWRGHVKADKFVMALRDYFNVDVERNYDLDGRSHAVATNPHVFDEADLGDPTSTQQTEKPPTDIERRVAPEDEWALPYITLSRIQPLIEAIDDDGSSFVTIKEVNKFTSAKPPDWSLLRWIAYWTYGFEMALQWYFRRIRSAISEIDEASYAVLPANRNLISRFTWDWPVRFVENLLSGLQGINQWDGIEFDTDANFAKFKDHVVKCEESIERNLRSVNYCIDDENTLAIVVGMNTLDQSPRQYLLPLIFLLMRRTLYIVRQAKDLTLHEGELGVIQFSLANIYRVVWDRVRTLQAVYRIQNLNVREQLDKSFHGLFSYALGDPEVNDYWKRSPYDDNAIIGATLPTESEVEAATSDTEQGIPHPDMLSLYYRPQTEEIDQFTNLSLTRSADSVDHPATFLLIGHWSASYSYHSHEGVLHFTITSHDGDGSIRGCGEDTLGTVWVRGTCDGGRLTLTLYSKEMQSYAGSPDAIVWHTKDFSPEASEIGGHCGLDQGNWYQDVLTGTDGVAGDGFQHSPIEEREQEHTAEATRTDPGMPAVSGVEDSGNEDAPPGNGEDTIVLGTFLMIRRSVEYMVSCPRRESLKENRTRALWKLAIDATLYAVRSRTLTWKRLYERRQRRTRYIELLGAQSESGFFQYQDDELDWVRVIRGIHPDDLRLWRAIGAFKARRMVEHWVVCDVCGVGKAGMSTHFRCIECSEDTIDQTADFCWTCSSSKKPVITASGKTHLPSHHLIQLRWPLWRVFLHHIFTDAKSRVSARQEDMRCSGGLPCMICTQIITSPPYLCRIDTADSGIICCACNVRLQREQPWMYERGAPDLRKPQFWWDYLVLVPGEQAPVDSSVDEARPVLEDRLSQLEAKLESQTARLASLEGLVRELLASRNTGGQ